jgi:hypothetical protein
MTKDAGMEQFYDKMGGKSNTKIGYQRSVRLLIP